MLDKQTRELLPQNLIFPEYDENGDKNLGYTVNVPLAANISANQKATRILEGVTFTARLAGAIHVVDIKGQLTYENLIVGGE